MLLRSCRVIPRETHRIFISRSISSSKFEMAPPILSLALPSETGRVLSIQSHTVQGYVGNKSAVFPLQLLGYDVDPVNSVQFSNHTGKLLILLHSIRYPTFKGQVLNGQQLWELMEGLKANDLLYYTHLLTGMPNDFLCYIGSVSFLNTVLEVVKKLRSINPKLTYVCDPVLGDEGKLYVPPELVEVYREKVSDKVDVMVTKWVTFMLQVVPVASMLTPNQFEAEQLTGFRIVSEHDGREACNKLHAAGPAKVVITSINIDGHLLLIGSHEKEKGQSPDQFKIVIPKIPAYFTMNIGSMVRCATTFKGTGDLMTALLLGWSNKHTDDLAKAAELAVSSLQAVLQRTLDDYKTAGYDPQSSSLEIRLIQSQDDIRHPQIKFKAENYS
ncbi:hypothetical protein POTOM_055369 [Populus tomentosa]|uniref:Pyridoxamine kinase/Phosphomethylpyrimidine kinase domain-containing protein n=1 Tax=Populus tomentosa TaxID=118781 RepID=A0A8X7Y502_POPTO|nr:hypothetical protein POTOM_055369 [Populus tomentosa]